MIENDYTRGFFIKDDVIIKDKLLVNLYVFKILITNEILKMMVNNITKYVSLDVLIS